MSGAERASRLEEEIYLPEISSCHRLSLLCTSAKDCILTLKHLMYAFSILFLLIVALMILPGLMGLFERIQEFLTFLIDFLFDTVMEIVNTLRSVWEFVTNIPDLMKGLFDDMLDELISVFSSVIDILPEIPDFGIF
jgi:hypothetical protein